MIKKFSIRNFKCFETLAIKQWERVNLIAGENNIGKTALLEAIFLHEGAHNAGLVFSIEKFRGIINFNNKDFLSDLFTEFKSDKKILLKAEYQNGKSLTLKLFQEESKQTIPVDTRGLEVEGTASITPKLVFEVRDNGNIVCKSAFFLGVDPQGRPLPLSSGITKQLSPTAIFSTVGFSKEELNKINSDRFSTQVEIKRKKEIINSLKLIDDRLQNLELVKRGNRNLVCGDIGYNKILPLSLMGEGMERYLYIVLSLLSAENGIILIDEIENGFHHSIHAKIWSNLGNLARKYNVQIIATTHSYECIRAAHESFKKDEEYDFILHRLDRVGEKIEAMTYDKATLESALRSDMEIR